MDARPGDADRVSITDSTGLIAVRNRQPKNRSVTRSVASEVQLETFAPASRLDQGPSERLSPSSLFRFKLLVARGFRQVCKTLNVVPDVI